MAYCTPPIIQVSAGPTLPAACRVHHHNIDHPARPISSPLHTLAMAAVANNDRSEMMFLGAECHHSACHLHDFLPFSVSYPPPCHLVATGHTSCCILAILEECWANGLSRLNLSLPYTSSRHLNSAASPAAMTKLTQHSAQPATRHTVNPISSPRSMIARPPYHRLWWTV